MGGSPWRSAVFESIAPAFAAANAQNPVFFYKIQIKQ
jgi:hypothetical protein